MKEIYKIKTKTDEAWLRLYRRLENDCLLEVGEGGAGRKYQLYGKWGTVAALLVGAVCGVMLWLFPTSGRSVPDLVTQENKEKSTLVKTLEDGSVVYLAQESTLRYPEHFDARQREVNLRGEAFFDIAKKPEQTFLIETEKVRIEVLGTAFDVRSKEDMPFSLSVRRGKVKVRLKKGGQSVLAKAGETVTLLPRGLQLNRTGPDLQFDPYAHNIRFKDEPLEGVLRVINKESLHWQIETASPALGKKKLTVEFADTSPESVAELICWTFNLKCLRQGNKLILSE